MSFNKNLEEITSLLEKRRKQLSEEQIQQLEEAKKHTYTLTVEEQKQIEAESCTKSSEFNAKEKDLSNDACELNEENQNN